MVNRLNKEAKFIIICNIYAGSAETAPPLGTILGNLGVNTVKFCKEFNDFTIDLPIYIKLEVTIFIHENKSFYFTIILGSVGHLISLLKK
jgi:large subunit ribosomal protein L11